MIAKPKDTDEYIASFPKETQKLLEQIRSTIKVAVPEAEELISYAIPSYKFHGMLVHFAGYEHHIGFYPGPSGISEFQKELSVYKGAKGSVQFPLDKPLPLDLVTKIVNFRKEENLANSKSKKKY